jgi:hypothetical protein
MAVFISQNQACFDQSFTAYCGEYDRFFRVLKQFETPPVSRREIRLFDIRLRLTAGMQVSFNDHYSYTKTETTRKTYSLIMKLSEGWFAYEALGGLLTGTGLLDAKQNSRIYGFPDSLVAELSLHGLMDSFNEWFRKKHLHKENQRADIQRYLLHLEENISRSGLKKMCREVSRKCDGSEPLILKEILAIIFAIRNMHVHNGDAALSGVSTYRTKIELMKNCYDFLICFCLRLGTEALKRKTDGMIPKN